MNNVLKGCNFATEVSEKLSNGMQIEMYIDNAINKIISAFPVQ